MLVLVLLAMAGVQTPALAAVTVRTVTLDAVADSFVATSATGTNNGRSTTLNVSRYAYHALLRFDLSSIPAGSQISAASLAVYSTTATDGKVLVHQQNDLWRETTLTAANQPTWNPQLWATTSNGLPNGGYVAARLPADAIPASGTVSFGLSTSLGALATLASRESANPPRLTVSYVVDGTNRGPQAPLVARATVETADLPPSSGTFDYGDISDDSAIWADPSRPANSVVIGDSKDLVDGGLAVYDMSGALIDFRKIGMIGNVDIRDGYALDGRSVVLVGANDRTDDSIVFYQLDRVSRKLSPIHSRVIPTQSDNYGFCLYRSPVSGKYFAFVTRNNSGAVQQFELQNNAGGVDAKLVRSFNTGSQTEACVADDQLANVYFAEEDVAIWKYSAEPDGGSSRTAVDRVGGGRVVADIEGLALTYGPNNTGSLVVSSQGNSRFAVYDRAGRNAFQRNFTVLGSGTVDAVTQTDGLDVSTANLGPGFEQGALVVHDAANSGGPYSNLKYVPLQQVLPPE